ncbi:hypothetical protein FNF28_06515 [Cafeteria roenbergensis]|uniref:Glutamate--tRNA ligase n=1 Tax=Cafeteria roenbergensis TaxID=33653 RepID=A0A5A8CXD0_CAFRO|nr:hypothetical protein FNF28_06515 [Cafeteria roenbergensis]
MCESSARCGVDWVLQNGASSPGSPASGGVAARGDLHLGGLRTALFAYLWARRHNGEFLLRIEDTDRTRLVDTATEDILDQLRWCGLSPDEGPFSPAAGLPPREPSEQEAQARAAALADLPAWAQGPLGGAAADAWAAASSGGVLGPYMQSERQSLGLYRAAAEAMLDAGTAYRCFCSAERLEDLRASQQRRGRPVMYDRACASVGEAESAARAAAGEPFTVRLRVPLSAMELPEAQARWAAARSGAGAAFASAEAAAGALPAPDGALPTTSADPTAGDGADGEGTSAGHGGRRGAASGHGMASTTVRDTVLGSVVFSHSAVDDCVLLKSDGWPTYHLASVVDDVTMKISDVIRGQEWLASAPKHALVYAGLGVQRLPRFTHLPLLLGADRRKLSKRRGDASVRSARDALAVSPEALLNFVAFLGWTPPTAAAHSAPGEGNAEDDVLSVAELAEHFALTGVHRSNAVVDRRRLDWMQGRHVRRALQAAWTPGGQGAGGQGAGGQRAGGDAAAVPPGVSAAKVASETMIAAVSVLDSAMAAVKATVKAFAKAAASDAAPDGQVPAAGSSAGEARKAKRKKLPASRLMLPLRWALTGQSVGPALGDVVGLLGREACLARLRAALQAAA